MYIVSVSHYIPEIIVSNQYFEELLGLSNDWLVERTGIRERRKAGETENTHSMGIKAVDQALQNLPFDISEIDLIVGATYTPHDTIVTLGHAIQHHLNIDDIPVLSISSACSSFINATEVVQGYFAMGKASKALVVVSEHNTAYNNEKDEKVGHLWGDGSAAMVISKEKLDDSHILIKDILTGGAATQGKAQEGVTLQPLNNGIAMPYGKDVFINACIFMPKSTTEVLNRNGYTTEDLSYLIPHQANLRITKNVAQTLKLDESKALSNIEYLGNTGCAGCVIAFSENKEKFKTGDKIVVTVFGGGYSYGAMLLEA